jgi:hypothetical protein
MQSDAIPFPNAMLDQATRESIHFRGRSFISPDFFFFDESNFLRLRISTMI